MLHNLHILHFHLACIITMISGALIRTNPLFVQNTVLTRLQFEYHPNSEWLDLDKMIYIIAVLMISRTNPSAERACARLESCYSPRLSGSPV
jgi:hypothetical protein